MYYTKEKRRYTRRVQAGFAEPTPTAFDLDLLQQQAQATVALAEPAGELLEHQLQMCQQGLTEPSHCYPVDMASSFGDELTTGTRCCGSNAPSTRSTAPSSCAGCSATRGPPPPNLRWTGRLGIPADRLGDLEEPGPRVRTGRGSSSARTRAG